LRGEPIGNGLWTDAKRRKILDSRIGMTDAVVKLMHALSAGLPCWSMVQRSAGMAFGRINL